MIPKIPPHCPHFEWLPIHELDNAPHEDWCFLPNCEELQTPDLYDGVSIAEPTPGFRRIVAAVAETFWRIERDRLRSLSRIGWTDGQCLAANCLELDCIAHAMDWRHWGMGE